MKLPITLGEKTIYIYVMVVQGPLDFNLLLGHDYSYAMGALVSSLFRVIFFPHEGQIITIYQLSFFGPNVTSGPPSYLLDIYPLVVSSPPQFNYVATCSFPLAIDSAIGYHLLGAFDRSFQDVILPSDVNLLEAMTSYLL